MAFRRLGLLLLLSWMGAALGWAQTATIRGFVTDANDGEALQGVNVILEQNGRLITGKPTDRDGFYAIRISPGAYVLKASFLGYTTFTDSLDLKRGEIRSVNIALVVGEEELDEVMVEGERTSGAARVTAGQQSVRPADIELVAAPDVSGDLVTYLSTIPGVVSVGDQGGQLFIRGGEPSQNLVLIDGIPIYQPFHVLGFYSAFPAEILSRADVYAGGFGSRYGGRLSSVIDVATRTGNKFKEETAFTFAPFVSSAHLEGPILPDIVSYLVHVRHAVVEQVAEPVLGQDLPYNFSDVFFKLHGRLSKNSQLSLTGLWTYDRGTLNDKLTEADEPLNAEVRWRNQGIGVRYLVLPKSAPLIADVRVSASRLKTELGPSEVPRRSSTVGAINSNALITYLLGESEVSWGFFIRTIEVNTKIDGLFDNEFTRTEYLTESGAFLEADVALGPLRVRPGLRLQSYPIEDETYLEPRLRVVWTQGIHELSGAFGVYHQKIIGLNDRRDAASIFTAWTTSPLGVQPTAQHGILGYRINPAPWLELSAEGYYKWLDDLYVAEWTSLPRFTTRLQEATGRAVGVDLRAELRTEPLYLAVNYGLGSVEYEAKQRQLAAWYGAERLPYRPAHDRRHQLNVIASTHVRGFGVNVRWQFGSGLPYNRVYGFDGFVLMDGVKDAFDEGGQPRVFYERPFNGVLPTYHRLDLSVDRSFEVGVWTLTVQGSIINVYDRSNLFYLDIFTGEEVRQLPILPSLGLKLENR